MGIKTAVRQSPRESPVSHYGILSITTSRSVSGPATRLPAAESGKPTPMSETESSLSRFTANAAGVQSHEVGLKVKGESCE